MIGSISTTRSRSTGRLAIGVMVTEPARKSLRMGSSWVEQASTERPFTRTVQEPQMAERQKARKVRLLSWVSLIRRRAERTVMPVSTSSLKLS